MAYFPSLKQNFIAYRSPSRPDCIFETHQLWQSDFSRVHSNSSSSCSFEPEILKIGQLSQRVYDNFKFLYKKKKVIEGTTYICIKYFRFVNTFYNSVPADN